MTPARLLATATATLALAAPLAATGAASGQTPSATCATKGYRIYARHNIGCTKAKRVMRQFANDFTAPAGWYCYGLSNGKCRNTKRGKRFKFVDQSLEGR